MSKDKVFSLELKDDASFLKSVEELLGEIKHLLNSDVVAAEDENARLRDRVAAWEESYAHLTQNSVQRAAYNSAVKELCRQRDYYDHEAREWKSKYFDLQNKTDDVGSLDATIDDLRQALDNEKAKKESYKESYFRLHAKVQEMNGRNNHLRDTVLKAAEQGKLK